MKTILFIVGLIMLRQIAVGQKRSQNIFFLEGTIQGKDSGYVYLYYNSEKTGVADSCSIKKGTFIFKGFITDPTNVMLTTKPMDKTTGENDLVEFYIDHTNMHFSADVRQLKDFTLAGSSADKDRIRLLKVKGPLKTEMVKASRLCTAYQKQYKELKENGSGTVQLTVFKNKVDSLNRMITLLYRREVLIDSFFIVQNPDSYVAADMLNLYMSTKGIAFPSIQRLFDNFPSRIKQSKYGRKIGKSLEEQNGIPLGLYVNNLRAVDAYGDTINLGMYKGRKYILLDFWASWCIPCRHITPFLRDLRSKNGNEMEIISIALDDRYDDWKKALIEDEMNWPQILGREKGGNKFNNNSIPLLQSINGLPFLMLIDKDLKIIRKFGSGDETVTPIASMDREISRIFAK